MSIPSYFMAKMYDATMRKSEELCLSAWRKELLATVRGDVLELGTGTGVNLHYYPVNLGRLVLSEPDANMRKQLEARVADSGLKNVEIASFGAEEIEVPDATFDCVVSTLVLCSVDSQERSLREIHRLLRPGGKLYFIEHVIADDDPNLLRWQKFWQPFWIFMCGNCHLTHNTKKAIEDAGFEIERIDNVSMLGAAAVVKPVIKGIARKRT